MRGAVAMLFVVAACGYRAGTFRGGGPLQTFPGARASLDCLDVSAAIHRAVDHAAVVEFSFGNRCDGAVAVDLARTRVVGRTAAGKSVHLVADPTQRVRALPIDGRMAGRELIAYDADGDAELGEVCVDLAAIAGVKPARWQCQPIGDGVPDSAWPDTFGAWSNNLRLPRFLVESGTFVRASPSLAIDRGGVVAHAGQSFAYRVGAPAGARRTDLAVVGASRIGASLPHRLYLAAELEFGGAVAPAPTRVAVDAGGPTLAAEHALVVAGDAVVGMRHRIGAGVLSFELAGGIRELRYPYRTTYANVPTADTTWITALAPVVEPRVRGELWATPWLTAGATVGASVIERDSWMAGVFLGFHQRAFAGER